MPKVKTRTRERVKASQPLKSMEFKGRGSPGLSVLHSVRRDTTNIACQLRLAGKLCTVSIRFCFAAQVVEEDIEIPLVIRPVHEEPQGPSLPVAVQPRPPIGPQIQTAMEGTELASIKHSLLKDHQLDLNPESVGYKSKFPSLLPH